MTTIVTSLESKLHALVAALDAAQGDDDLPVQQLQILFAIAARSGINSTELQKVTGTSQSSVSRNVAALSEWHRLGKPGLNLVEVAADPQERRRNVHFLTAKGKRRVERTLTALTGQPVKYEQESAAEYLAKIHKGNSGAR